MSAPKQAEVAYTIAEAAELKRVSRDLLLRAIHAKQGPTLSAKRVGKGYRVSASALEAWWSALDDA